MAEELQLDAVYDIVVEHPKTHDHFPMKGVTYRGVQWWRFKDPDSEVVRYMFEVRDDPWYRAIPPDYLIEWHKWT